MNGMAQIIRDREGREEYVILPFAVYAALREKIDEQLNVLEAIPPQEGEFVPFDPADYVNNPVALARMKAGVKQAELARRLGVSQAYVSKVEKGGRVSKKMMDRVREALGEGAACG